jgi:hypothetical protein
MNEDGPFTLRTGTAEKEPAWQAAGFGMARLKCRPSHQLGCNYCSWLLAQSRNTPLGIFWLGNDIDDGVTLVGKWSMKYYYFNVYPMGFYSSRSARNHRLLA